MRLLVIGAGGHAKVVLDAARAAMLDVAGVVDPSGACTDLLGMPVSRSADGISADSFIVAVGDNRARARFFDEYSASGMRPASVIHPSAVIAPGVEIGDGTFIAAGVVVNVDARIGSNVILNTSCSVDHDCVVGDHAHVGPTCGLCGGVTVGAGALIGVGCSIIPRRSVGEWAIVGAGSTVIRDVPDSDLQAGVPARPINSIEE